MDVLPDILKPNLIIVFCGMAAGTRSAKMGAYYAGVGNKFWKTLYEIGLTPCKFSPGEFREAITYGIGLTDLVKGASGNDSVINPTNNDRATLKGKVELYQPGLLAFTGKGSAQFFLGRFVDCGIQKECVGRTKIYVLPSTSLQANWCWDASYWHELALSVKMLV